MGLAAPRKRRKIAQDPNNTAWARSTNGYGQRMLAAQGWTPGSYLGAHNAAHADHYSAGSASHIRVLLKDDNLGLGASRSKEAEPTGLGNFQDLLGRLNGKEKARIKEDQQARKTLGVKLYAQQRWGITPFVKAGYLVGDRIEPTPPKTMSHTLGELQKSAAESQPADPENEDIYLGDAARASAASATDSKATRRLEKSRLKEEKRVRKEERRKFKEERRVRKEARRAARAETAQSAKPPVAQREDSNDQVLAEPRRAVATQRGLNVRQRYLAQKRKAAMDPQAMREILMMKA